MLGIRGQFRAGVGWVLLGLCCPAAEPATANDNLITNGDFEAPELAGGWVAPEHVILERVETEGAGKALRLEWNELAAFERWSAAGGLLKNLNHLLSAPLQRDTRYRLSCRLKVERFDVSREAEAFLKTLPEGQYDRPTIGVGCYGGTGNSGMPWMAYDMSQPGTWQELESEFVTPFTGSRVFGFMLDAYPHYRSPMKSNGVLYLDDVKVVPAPPRVGFTRVKTAPQIDGYLGDWWQANPAVVTRDMTIRGDEGQNGNASGVVYTAWDDEKIYLAAKVVDDDVQERDRFVVLLGAKEFEFPVVTGSRTQNGEMVFAARRQSNVGSTVDMYRIVSQHGDAVSGRDGYVVEAALSHEGRNPAEVAFEIRDWDDGTEQGRVLRYPRVKGHHSEIQLA